MMLARTLRAVAVAIALAAIVDPAFVRRTLAPLAVDLQMAGGTNTADVRLPARAVSLATREIQGRLQASLGGAVVFNSSQPPQAVVLIGNAVDAASVPTNIPVSTISEAPPARNLRIAAIEEPRSVPPGWSAAFRVRVEARGFAGRSSNIVLAQQGVELQRVDHRWGSDDEQVDMRLDWTPVRAGLTQLRVRVVPMEGESTDEDNEADVSVVAEARVLRIASFDARPSWASTFVRRALEADPAFEVSSLVRASRGLAVRTIGAPAALNAIALEPFDLALIGSPEELTRADVEALQTFARVRGGVVTFLPDRKPSGPYLELLPGGALDEVLVDKPLEVAGAAGIRLEASELALLRGAGPATTAIASVRQGGSLRPVIVAAPAGAGEIVFSGALDSWRFRAAEEDAFARFWRATIAGAAARAPRRLELSVYPRLSPPGGAVTVRAAVRATEIAGDARRSVVPRLTGRLTAADGAAIVLRFWPAAEPGVYEARLAAPPSGLYDVRAELDTGVAADTILAVSNAAPPHAEGDGDARQFFAAATGGVNVTTADLQPLTAHLRALGRREVRERVWPMRSPWWSVAFAGALCGEWTLRRRHGGK